MKKRSFIPAIIQLNLFLLAEFLYGEPNVIIDFADHSFPEASYKETIEIFDEFSQKDLGTLKPRGPLILDLPSGSYRLNIKSIRNSLVVYEPNLYTVRPFTLDIHPDTPSTRITLHVKRAFMTPHIYSFQAGLWTEEQKKKPGQGLEDGWKGFLGLGAAYPLSSYNVDLWMDLGTTYVQEYQDIISGGGLRLRVMGSPLNRGLWAGALGHLEFMGFLRLGGGAFFNFLPPQIPQGSPYMESQIPWLVLPAVFTETIFKLSPRGTGWQLGLGVWIFPSYTASLGSGAEMLINMLLLRPLWPTIRPEAFVRYVFPKIQSCPFTNQTHLKARLRTPYQNPSVSMEAPTPAQFQNIFIGNVYNFKIPNYTGPVSLEKASIHRDPAKGVERMVKKHTPIFACKLFSARPHPMDSLVFMGIPSNFERKFILLVSPPELGLKKCFPLTRSYVKVKPFEVRTNLE